MKELELYEDDLIELGLASVETKGDAIYKSDVGVGQQLYVMGIAND
jgi:hypothetical protein|nr:benenodin family lasso peptide [uncultured Sphingorhabdus sp.]